MGDGKSLKADKERTNDNWNERKAWTKKKQQARKIREQKVGDFAMHHRKHCLYY